MVACQLPKLIARVRFPLPAPDRISQAIIAWTDVFRRSAEQHRISMKYASLGAKRFVEELDARKELVKTLSSVYD
jgi:hypothetical protein